MMTFAVDIPSTRRRGPHSSSQPLSNSYTSSNVRPGRATSPRINELYDFSDAFGPLPERTAAKDCASSLGRTPLGSSLAASVEAQELATWAPPDSISEGEPLVICQRSHSLVGPALTSARTSLTLSRASSRRISSEEQEPPPADVARTADVAGKDGNGGPAFAEDAELLEEEMFFGGQMDGIKLEIRGAESIKSTQNLAAASLMHDKTNGMTDSEASAVADVTDGLTHVTHDLAKCSVNGARQDCHLQSADSCTQSDRSTTVGPNDFELLRVVGQGAFGKVFQVQKRDTGEIFAMKVMRKDRILERDQGDYMKAERDILTRVMHPFIVQLQYSFQTSAKLYLLLDFINGGHLFFQLYRQGTFSEDLSRLYTAELVLAVGHLHSLGIMHRDLKPENILLDSEGHIKLTDFGLAKEVRDTTKSMSLCGTMEYMAPEIIQGKGYGRMADWWSIGILLFEMLTGQPPFEHSNRNKLQQKVLKDKIKFPPFLTSEAHSLLKGLLQKDPSKRLGSGLTGVDEIKSHKFFRAIHWGKLERREIHPKFCPTVNGKHCTANFDEMWTALPVNDSPAGTPTLEGGDYLKNYFRGYSFVASTRNAKSRLDTVDSDSDGEAPSSGGRSEGEEI